MSVIELVIGWLAPPQCLGCGSEGFSLCPICAEAEVLPHGGRCFMCGALSRGSRTCNRCRPSAPRHVWINTDYENMAKQLLKLYKYGHQRAAAKPIAAMMAQTFKKLNSPDWAARNYLVIPVPTATSRVRQRGFDHAQLLAQEIARRLGLDFKPAATRLGQARQVGAKRAERLKQQANNYLIRPKSAVAGRNILIIDDVATTGATLRAVTKQLRAAGARQVDALIFAKRL